MMHRLIILLTFAFAGFSATATEPEAVTHMQLQELAKDYYASQLESSPAVGLFSNAGFQPLHNTRCEDDTAPPIGSCVDSICSKLPSYECDSESDLRDVASMCRNQIDGSCIAATCNLLPSYECDSRSDMQDIARSCQGTSGRCISGVCGRLPSYECDSKSDVNEIGRMCQGLFDGSCVEAVCNRLPSYECDSKSDLQRVIQTCKIP